jgi:rsbT antagonist protein RsbS
MDPTRLPIIKLWDQILVPLQGEITDAIAERLREDVLRTIHDSGAAGLVLDITGVWMMDSHLCSVLSRLASAARLMGASTILTGMSPDTAITLQTMGVELEGVRTALTVEDAFEFLGIRRVGRVGRGPNASAAVRESAAAPELARPIAAPPGAAQGSPVARRGAP